MVARQHPGEAMAEWFVEGFLDRLTDPHDGASMRVLEHAVFYVVSLHACTSPYLHATMCNFEDIFDSLTHPSQDFSVSVGTSCVFWTVRQQLLQGPGTEPGEPLLCSSAPDMGVALCVAALSMYRM